MSESAIDKKLFDLIDSVDSIDQNISIIPDFKELEVVNNLKIKPEIETLIMAAIEKGQKQKKIQAEFDAEMEGKSNEEKISKFCEMTKTMIREKLGDNSSKAKEVEDIFGIFFNGMIPVMEKIESLKS